jgi:hypothetical protein
LISWQNGPAAAAAKKTPEPPAKPIVSDEAGRCTANCDSTRQGSTDCRPAETDPSTFSTEENIRDSGSIETFDSATTEKSPSSNSTEGLREASTKEPSNDITTSERGTKDASGAETACHRFSPSEEAINVGNGFSEALW